MQNLENKCPLCLEISSYKVVSGTHDMYFSCKSCKKEFIIEDLAYDVLIKYKQDVKEENIKSFAHPPTNHIWHLRMETKPEKEGMMFGVVRIDFISKGNLQY